MGRVMILMYHQIGPEEQEWVRSRDNFRRDLETLYREGYRLVSLHDYLDGRIDLPAGYSPVILTFDDSSRSQFSYIDPGGAGKNTSGGETAGGTEPKQSDKSRLEDRLEDPVIDPSSAVGILLDFQREHPNFGLEATFYINYPSPFGQPAYAAQKVKQIVDLGMDLGNHTYNHLNLRTAAPETARKAIARVLEETARILPGYELRTIALPFGAWPSDPAILLQGEAGGTSYFHEAVLMVGAEPAPSPFSPRFRPERLPRIQARDSEFDRWLGHFRAHPEDRYVSDGDSHVVYNPAAR